MFSMHLSCHFSSLLHPGPPSCPRPFCPPPLSHSPTSAAYSCTSWHIQNARVLSFSRGTNPFPHPPWRHCLVVRPHPPRRMNQVIVCLSKVIPTRKVFSVRKPWPSMARNPGSP